MLGALDPYTHKVFTGAVHSASSSSSALSLPEETHDHRQGEVREFCTSVEVIEWFNYERCTLEEFYPLSAIGNLMVLISDDSLNHIYSEIAQAILTIFRKLGQGSQEYVQQVPMALAQTVQVVPRLIEVTKTCRQSLRQFFLKELASLISIVGQSAKPYMRSIFSLIAVCPLVQKRVDI